MKDEYKTKEQLIKELQELRQQNIRFKEAEEQYSSLINNIPSAIYRSNINFSSTYITGL